MAIWAPIVLSGLAGALIGVLASALLQGWQFRRASHDAKAAGRIIYLEITYNIVALDEGRRGRPPTLRVTRAAWDAHSAQLASLLSEVEIAAVAAPYLRLDTWNQLFGLPTMSMIRPRLLGYDLRALEALIERFRAAEKVLRPKVWSGPRTRDVEAALALPPSTQRASPIERGLNVIALVRPSRVVLFLALFEIVNALLQRLRALENAITGLGKSPHDRPM
jgi:hypothetical protein